VKDVIPDLRGQILEGKYRLTDPIGSGGMGFVYAAQHVRLGRRLAVKFLLPELAESPEALFRFQQEATAVGRIGSPHIVDVIDLGTTPQGAPFLVMEFLDGRPLSALLDETPVLPMPRIAHILCQTFDALETAHEQGIVHRDLKPENVFLLARGAWPDFVKLLDFGISKILGDGSFHTRTGALLGTPRYMAPEQATGSGAVDQRADLWSVGVILYRALTGRFPHPGTGVAEIVTAIVTTEPVAPRLVRPDLDPAIEALVLRALARNPAARFPTAAAFREALSPWRTSLPVAMSVPPTPSVPAREPEPTLPASTSPASVPGVSSAATHATSPGSRAPLWFLAFGLAALIGGIVTFVLLSRSPSTTSSPPPAPPLPAAHDAAPLVVPEPPPVPVVPPRRPGEPGFDDRELYVRITVDQILRVRDLERAASGGEVDLSAVLERVAAKHGLTMMQYGELAARLSGDAAANDEIRRRIADAADAGGS
jgi:serine/threonine-protein kinase